MLHENNKHYAGHFGKVKMGWHRKTQDRKSERHWRLPHSWLAPNVKIVTFVAQWALSSHHRPLQTSEAEKELSVNKAHTILHWGKDNRSIYFGAGPTRPGLALNNEKGHTPVLASSLAFNYLQPLAELHDFEAFFFQEQNKMIIWVNFSI